jgi:hypothetical protein
MARSVLTLHLSQCHTQFRQTPFPRTTGFGNRSHYKQSHEMIKRSMNSYKPEIPRINDLCGRPGAGTTTGILALPMRYAGIPASALIKTDHIPQFFL